MPSTAAEPRHLTRPKYRADIDGLRGIAVLAVVGFHAFPGRVKGGFIGVDVFFVVSGFLISSIIFSNLQAERFSYREFYARRIKRIFPALILVLAAGVLFGWFVLVPSEYKKLGKHIAAGAAFFSNFALWREAGYFDDSASAKPLLHLWSLAIEEQFYIVWPPLLWLVWKRGVSVLTVTLLIGIGSFAINIYAIGTHPISAFYSPLSRYWELMLGGVLAYVTLHGPEHVRRWPNCRSICGLTLITLGIGLLNKDVAFPGWWALLPTVGAFLVISAGPQGWFNRHLLGNRALVFVGLISYPLYLWHWPVLYAVGQLNLSMSTPAQLRLARVIAILLSVLLAWLTYRLVETPIRFGASGKLLTAALAAGMVALCVAGYAAYHTDGFAYRVPREMSAILSYEDDYVVSYRRGTCFLTREQNEAQFSDCTSIPAKASTRSVVLWGDSHAAHLYPGLKNTAGADVKITQLTAAFCPPIIGFDSGYVQNCKPINDYVSDLIARNIPDEVILAARWDDYDWKQVRRTIEYLRRVGIKHIALVGPVPQWFKSLPIQLYYYTQSGTTSKVPHRMRTGLRDGIRPIDVQMRQFAADTGVNYISAFEILCNEQGCLTMVGDSPSALTAWDYGHLTTAGSTYLVSHFPSLD